MKIRLLTVCLMIALLVGCFASCGITGTIVSGTDSLEISQEDSVEKMNQLAKTEGYHVKFDYSDSDGETGTYEVGKKGDILWMIETTDAFTNGTAYSFEDSGVNTFSYEDDEWVYTSTIGADYYEEMRDYYELGFTYWFYFGNTYDGLLKKGSDTTVAGRKCDTYTFSLGALTSLMVNGSFEYKIAVDKELGITLSLDMSTTEDGETSGMSYHITEFKTGSDVKVPTFPAVKTVFERAKFNSDDFSHDQVSEVKLSTQAQDSAMLFVTLKSSDAATFNAYGAYLFGKCKAVADEGKIYDDSGEEMTAWKDAEGSMIGASFSYKADGETVNVGMYLTEEYIMLQFAMD